MTDVTISEIDEDETRDFFARHVRSLLRMNVAIPRHAGVDNSSFLPLSLNHPIGPARIDLHPSSSSLAFALRQR